MRLLGASLKGNKTRKKKLQTGRKETPSITLVKKIPSNISHDLKMIKAVTRCQLQVLYNETCGHFRSSIYFCAGIDIRKCYYKI